MMRARLVIASMVVSGLTLLLAAQPAWAGQKFEIAQIISSRVARQFLETVPFDKYEATQISVAEEKSWHDPAMYLDLKGDEWKVEFLNDRFFSRTRQHYGDLSEPEPVKGDLRKAALELLERDLVKVYQINPEGAEGGPYTAIVLSPYSINAVASGDVLRIRLSQSGLQAREGDEPEHDLSFLGRIRGRMYRRPKMSNGGLITDTTAQPPGGSGTILTETTPAQ